MKKIKLILMFCLFLVMSGCMPGPPKWMEERREKINNSNNKLTISQFEIGKPPIVIENVKDFELLSRDGRISYKKDNKEYEYKGDYFLEIESYNKPQEQ